MSAPIKLTDEVINEIVLHEDTDLPFGSADLQHAIRTLRDRARAVVDDAYTHEAPGEDIVASRLIRKLREVLP